MESEQDDLIRETHRLAKENNKMLRAMRRSAWTHTIFKLILYGIMAAVAIWFYINYVAPLLLQMLETLNKIQGASNQAHDQLSSFTSTLEKLRSFIPGASSTSAH